MEPAELFPNGEGLFFDVFDELLMPSLVTDDGDSLNCDLLTAYSSEIFSNIEGMATETGDKEESVEVKKNCKRRRTEMEKVHHASSERQRTRQLAESFSKIHEIILQNPGTQNGFKDRGVKVTRIDIAEEATNLIRKLKNKVDELRVARTQLPKQLLPPCNLPLGCDVLGGLSVTDYAVCFQKDPVARALVSMDGNFYYCNESYIQVTGMPESSKKYQELSMWSICDPTQFSSCMKAIVSLMHGEQKTTVSAAKFSRFFTSYCYSYNSLSLVKDESGRAKYICFCILPLNSEVFSTLSCTDPKGPIAPDIIAKLESISAP